MSRRRAIAIAVLACAGLAGTAAATSATARDGWRSLPSVAEAATEAAGEAAFPIAEVRGDPADGCFAVTHSVALTKSGDVWPAFRASLEEAGTTLSECVEDGEALTCRFARDPHEGTFTAMVDRGDEDARVRVEACFWNQREPARCRRACGVTP